MTKEAKLILLMRAIAKQFTEESKIVHFLGFIIEDLPNLLEKYNKKYAEPADPEKWDTAGKPN